MRYHSKVPKDFTSSYGQTYTCNHPVYSVCTLYLIGAKGLAVIQQRYNPVLKTTWWDRIDPWIVDKLYMHPSFKGYFDKRASFPIDGIYPTVTVRQIMWALRMKPLRKERWETTFDRKDI